MSLLQKKSKKNTKTTKAVAQFNDTILEAIRDRKGHDIVKLDLRHVHDAPVDFFFVCHGTSDTQVKAIANSVAAAIKEEFNERPNHIEGKGNGTWVLVDYFTVVVHVFSKEARTFYKLEELWSDAVRTEYQDL